LDYINHIFILLPIVTGIYRRHYVADYRELRIAVSYFCIVFMLKTIQLYSSPVWRSVQFYNLYMIVEALLIGWMYFYIFEKKFYKRYVLIATSLCVILTSLTYKVGNFSATGDTVFRLFCVNLSLFHFIKLIDQMRVATILLYSLFWISGGLLIYSAGTLCIYLISQFVIGEFSDADTFHFYWNVKQFLSIVFCIMAAVGMWVSKYDRENYT